MGAGAYAAKDFPATYFCQECRRPFTSAFELRNHETRCAPRLRPQTDDDGWIVIPPISDAEHARHRDDLVALLEELE